jgi:hypothetical protein
MASSVYFSPFYPPLLNSGVKGSTVSVSIPPALAADVELIKGTVNENIQQINFNADTMALEVAKGAARDAYIEAQTTIDGQKVATFVKQAVTQVQTDTDALAQTVNLLGAVVPGPNGGSVFQFSLDTASVSPGESLGQRLTSIKATMNDNVAAIETLNNVVVGPEGSEARSVLKLDVNNRISGFVTTNDGKASKFIILADSFQVISATGNGQAVTPFSVTGNIVTMSNVEVDTIKAGSVTIAGIQAGLSNVLRFTAPDVLIGTNVETTILETPAFSLGQGGVEGSAISTLSFTQDSLTANDTGARIKVYVDVGGGYQLVRNRVTGVSTNSGQTYWALQVTIPLSISAAGNVRIKVTGTGEKISGGGYAAGAYARDISVDVLKIAR